MSHESRLDIILFGATGFTGKHTIPVLTEIIKSENLSLTWGIAGRSVKKLKNVLLEIQEKSGEDYSNIPIIEADVSDVKSIENMSSMAKIIMNAVGPYRIYGESVIQACIKTGTHHVDISAELQFIESMQLKYDDAAVNKRICLVSACGFGSIPTDLGIVHLQKNFEGTLNSVETYLDVMNDDGAFHPGTIVHHATFESLLNVFAYRDELEAIRSKLHSQPLPTLQPELKFNGLIFRNNSLNRWCGIFPGPDRSVALETQRYFYETYKRRAVQIQTYVCPKNLLQMLVLGIIFLISLFMASFNFTRRLLFRHPKFFTLCLVSRDGPSEEQQAKITFDLHLVGEGWSDTSDSLTKFDKPPDKRMVAKVSGRNPGYGSTCVMFALAAIIILTEREKIPNCGGCYTPGIAFANTSMVEKLNRHGVKFELRL